MFKHVQAMFKPCSSHVAYESGLEELESAFQLQRLEADMRLLQSPVRCERICSSAAFRVRQSLRVATSVKLLTIWVTIALTDSEGGLVEMFKDSLQEVQDCTFLGEVLFGCEPGHLIQGSILKAKAVSRRTDRCCCPRCRSPPT